MILIIQNDPQCPPGSCSELLRERGLPFTLLPAYRESSFPDPEQLSGVIVLGGEMSVYQTEAFPYLASVLDFMGRVIAAGKPLLGICLGGQLLARVAGGEVASPSSHGEQGICEVEINGAGENDPLLAGLPERFVTFQLHDDSFTPPAGAALLASSARCPSQLFRLGRGQYALQFHPEVDRAIVSEWGRLSTPPLDFLPAFLAAEPLFQEANHRLIANFISLCSPAPQS